MYKNINDAFDKVIEQIESEGKSKEIHNLVQGVKIAKQIIKQEQAHSTGEYAYEALEHVVRSLQDTLDYEEAVEVVNKVYWDK